MLLYDSAISGKCCKVRLLLAHLGLPCERRDVDVVDRSAKRDFLGGPTRRGACRRSCSTTGGRSRSRTRSSGTSARARRSFPTIATSGQPCEGGFSLAERRATRAWLERVAAERVHVTIDA